MISFIGLSVLLLVICIVGCVEALHNNESTLDLT